MKNQNEMILMQDLNIKEMQDVNGGEPITFGAAFLAISGACVAALAIYECGKAAGEFIYYVTH